MSKIDESQGVLTPLSVLKRDSAANRTPSGISKTLLTPCRRMGLSRNRKSLTPIAHTNPGIQQNVTKPHTVDPYANNESICKNDSPKTLQRPSECPTTPSIQVEKPSKAKSKQHLIKNISNILKRSPQETIIGCKSDSKKPFEGESIQVKKPVKGKSNQKSKEILVALETSNKALSNTTNPHDENKSPPIKSKDLEEEVNSSVIENKKISEPKQLRNSYSPELSLTKQCIVVIDNSILKDVSHKSGKSPSSDSENEVLATLATSKCTNNVENCKRKEDTCNDSTPKSKKPKLEKSLQNHILINTSATPPSQSSQSSYQSDDDDFCPTTRTTMIKKTYNKATKPIKSKSTGSITQSDINKIKMQIKMKQNELKLKSKGNNTTELQNLIKKWRKGCQDALMELLELMKNQLPGKEHMELPQLLNMLNIPPDLVNYDMLEDCFN